MGFALTLSGGVEAHETNVHQMLTSAAIEYLIQKRPELAACDLEPVRQALGLAVWDEDNPFGTHPALGGFLFHFLPALDDELTDATLVSLNILSSCDSTEWASGGVCRSEITPASGVPFLKTGFVANDHDIATALTKLKAHPPQKEPGLSTLGRILHLLQDLTSPPHVQNDAHPASPFYPLLARPGFVFDPSTFEVVNHKRPEITARFSIRAHAANPVGPIPWWPADDLVMFQNPLQGMRELAQIVSSRFPSEKTVNTHPAVVGQQQPGNDYILDPVTKKRIAVRRWGTGDFAIDRVAALEQFDALAPLAIQYTASMIWLFHQRSPVCEQQLKLAVAGVGQVTSSPDDVRPAPDDQIACGSGLAGQERCDHYFPSGKRVTLTAAGEDFRGWSVAECPGQNTTCTVDMDDRDPKEVEAYFGDPVAGVYTLTAIDGRALPAPILNDPNLSITGGQIRFNEHRVWTNQQTGIDGTANATYDAAGLVPPDPVPRLFQLTDLVFYRVGDVSATPIPLGLHQLPPGRVIHGLAGSPLVEYGPRGTLAANGTTLTLLSNGSLFRFERQPLTRTMDIQPANRTLVFTDTRQGDTSIAKSLIVTNTGTEPLTLRSSSPSVLPRDFTLALRRGVCDQAVFAAGNLLEPGTSCEFDLEFTPELTYRTGPRTATLTLRTNAGSTSGLLFQDVTFALEGTATGVPRAEVTPLGLSFQATAAGAISAPQMVTVRNTGDVPLELGFPRSSAFSFSVNAAGCRNLKLDPGAACSMAVTFQPTSIHIATLSVPTNSDSTAGSQVTNINVALHAENEKPVARAVPMVPELLVGDTVAINGQTSSDFEGYFLSYSWRIVSAPAGSAAVLSDEHSDIPLLTPDLPGRYVLELVVNDGLLDSDPVLVSVIAALPPGVLSLSAGGLSFPAMPIGRPSPSQTLTLTNTGGSAVTVTNVSVSGDFSASNSTCSIVPMQQTCTIDVVFTPTAAGVRRGELTILSDATNSPVRILLAGGSDDAPIAAPVVTGPGEITLAGDWTLRFFGGDDDEASWVKIGNDPEFEWEEDESPGRIVLIEFGAGEGTVRFAEGRNAGGLRPITIEPLPDGRYLLHLRDDDPPFEVEVTLVLERMP